MIQVLYQAFPVPKNIRKYNYKISPKIRMELSEGKSVPILVTFPHALWRHYGIIQITLWILNPVEEKLQTIIFRMVCRSTL